MKSNEKEKSRVAIQRAGAERSGDCERASGWMVLQTAYVSEDHIVRGYAIRCDEQEEVWVRGRVDVPDLSL